MAEKESSVEPAATVASAGQTNNPLSRKLNKILETRLDNDKVSKFLASMAALLLLILFIGERLALAKGWRMTTLSKHPLFSVNDNNNECVVC